MIKSEGFSPWGLRTGGEAQSWWYITRKLHDQVALGREAGTGSGGPEHIKSMWKVPECFGRQASGFQNFTFRSSVDVLISAVWLAASEDIN